jgi:NAD(P)-dependent dehydrogenase (short-subunit alcohol dehydrogenase family)
MIRTLAVELAPLRVNAIHPGVVGDSHARVGNPAAQERARSRRTPTGRLATKADCVGATLFLLDNQAVNGVNLVVDGGWTLS